MASNVSYDPYPNNGFAHNSGMAPRNVSGSKSNSSAEQPHDGHSQLPVRTKYSGPYSDAIEPSEGSREHKFPVMVQIQYKNDHGISDGGHELISISKDPNMEQLKVEITQRFKEINKGSYNDRANLLNHNLAWTDDHKICSIKVVWHLASAWSYGAAISETFLTEKNLPLALTCMDRHNCVDTLCVLLCVPE